RYYTACNIHGTKNIPFGYTFIAICVKRAY
ncbi:MAG: hypothetical protein ACI90V_011656, partial [Bacillariaceae sp.]